MIYLYLDYFFLFLKSASNNKRAAEIQQKLKDGKLVLDTINLADYKEEDNLESYTLEIPDGVTLHADTNMIHVNIRFPDLGVMDIMTQQFEIINLPEGLKAEVKDKEMTVTIRGLASGMQSLMRENVKVILDLSKVVEGENKITPTIEITNDKLPGAGALGTYEVTVEVQKIPGKKK